MLLYKYLLLGTLVLPSGFALSNYFFVCNKINNSPSDGGVNFEGFTSSYVQTRALYDLSSSKHICNKNNGSLFCLEYRPRQTLIIQLYLVDGIFSK